MIQFGDSRYVVWENAKTQGVFNLILSTPDAVIEFPVTPEQVAGMAASLRMLRAERETVVFRVGLLGGYRNTPTIWFENKLHAVTIEALVDVDIVSTRIDYPHVIPLAEALGSAYAALTELSITYRSTL